jgi:4-amino-4-deoxy-L-arabinose transferase-like glycosyltransferase
MIIKYVENHPVTSIFLFSLLLLLPNLNSAVLTIMEARNFITAREMVLDGNWILTTMNGNPRYEKPPLPTWLTAISGMLFGMKSLFALRLPAALMVTFSGFFMYLFAKKLTKDQILSTIIGFIFITSFYIIGIINEAPWDIFTHGFMIAAIYFLFQFFETNTAIWKNAILAGILGGLSLMSKGPVSLYVLLLPFLISYAILFKFKHFKGKALPLLTFIILMFAIGGWWFIYVRMVDNEAFIEIAKKETSRWGSYNVRPFYYYWSFFVQSGIWAILALVGLIYPYIIKRVTNKKIYKFTFLWTSITLILLSIIPEKKSRYLVPILFPLAINTGLYVYHLILNFKDFKSKRDSFPVYFNFGFFGLLGFAIPIAALIILKERLDGLWIPFGLLSASMIAIGFYLFKSLKSKNIKNAFYGQVTFMLAFLVFGMPLSKALHDTTSFKNISDLKNEIEREQNIKSYAFKGLTPELLWYYGDTIEKITTTLPLEDTLGILVKKVDEEEFKQLTEGYKVELIETYDLNHFKKKRIRLERDYYLITKNTIFD